MSNTLSSSAQKPIEWNDTAILQAAGERPEPIQKLLQRHAQPTPSDLAVYQWWSRKLIPNTWRPKLVYALMRENQIDVTKLFRVGSGRRTSLSGRKARSPK